MTRIQTVALSVLCHPLVVWVRSGLRELLVTLRGVLYGWLGLGGRRHTAGGSGAGNPLRLRPVRLPPRQCCGFLIEPTRSPGADTQPLPSEPRDRGIAAAWQREIAERLFMALGTGWLPGGYRGLLDQQYANPVVAFAAFVRPLGFDPETLRGPTPDAREVQWLRSYVDNLVEIEQWGHVPAAPYLRLLVAQLARRRHDPLTLARMEQVTRIGSTLEAILAKHDPDANPPVMIMACHRQWREDIAVLAGQPELFTPAFDTCDAELHEQLALSHRYLDQERGLDAYLTSIEAEAQGGIAKTSSQKTMTALLGMRAKAHDILAVLTNRPEADPEAYLNSLKELYLELCDLLTLDADPDPAEAQAVKDHCRLEEALDALGFDAAVGDLTLDQVRLRYRQLIRLHHPDRARDKADAQERDAKTKELNLAWNEIKRLWPIIFKPATANN